jgi:hypothetical protein
MNMKNVRRTNTIAFGDLDLEERAAVISLFTWTITTAGKTRRASPTDKIRLSRKGDKPGGTVPGNGGQKIKAK